MRSPVQSRLPLPDKALVMFTGAFLFVLSYKRQKKRMPLKHPPIILTDKRVMNELISIFILTYE